MHLSLELGSVELRKQKEENDYCKSKLKLMTDDESRGKVCEIYVNTTHAFYQPCFLSFLSSFSVHFDLFERASPNFQAQKLGARNLICCDTGISNFQLFRCRGRFHIPLCLQ